MNLTRREFAAKTCAVAGTMLACSGCAGSGDAGPPALRPTSINAGPVADYPADGVSERFRDKGFFIVRRGTQLIALSSMCTHRACKLDAQPDHTFHCKCHGSTFDAYGKVTRGPARRDLPDLPTSVDANGHLHVNATAM